ncbi:MAG: aldo/keto reductase, partial [Verrucomicrobiota bacterium]
MNSRRTFLKSAVAGAAGLGVAGAGSQASAAENTAAVQPVDRRTLGRTEAEVSILGLGLGSAFTKPRAQDPEAAIMILEKALEFGINYWDTSRGYKESESLIAPVLQQHRDDIFLVTKSKGRTYDAFMRDIETSLKTLKTDHIDLMHIWNLPAEADLDEIEQGALKAIHKLRDEKVISHFGVTGHSGAQILMDAINRFDPDALLSVYPCTRDDEGRYEDQLLPLARERKMGVVAMKTVKRARNAELIGSDLVRYALSLEGIASTIVGLDTLGHLLENVQMATDFKPLTPKEMVAMHQDVSRAV